MPLTTDYTFKLNNSGVVLNDDSSGIPYVDIQKVSGLDSAPYRETIRDHEGVDGGFIDAEFEKGREIILEGEVYCDLTTVEPYLDNLKANYAPVTTPIPFYFKSSGVTERLLFVKPRGVRFDWEQARRIGVTLAQFLLYAEDPRIYDSTLSSVSIAYGGAATTGFGFSFGFNLSFGATVPVTGGNVVVTGNRPTPAILTITGPIVNPRVINSTDGKTLSFVITLGALDSLVIDLNNKTVLLNNVTNRRNTLVAPDWFLFNPGTTNVVLGGLSGTGSLLIEWRNAWR